MCENCHARIINQVSGSLRRAGVLLLEQEGISRDTRTVIGSAYAAADTVLNLATRKPFESKDIVTLSACLAHLLMNRKEGGLLSQENIEQICETIAQITRDPKSVDLSALSFEVPPQAEQKEVKSELSRITQEIFPGAELFDMGDGSSIIAFDLEDMLQKWDEQEKNEVGHPHDPNETVERGDLSEQLDELSQQDRDRTDSPPEEPLPQGEDESEPVEPGPVVYQPPRFRMMDEFRG